MIGKPFGERGFRRQWRQRESRTSQPKRAALAATIEAADAARRRETSPLSKAIVLRQYRTNELVRRQMNFSSDAMADFEGLLDGNRKNLHAADGEEGNACAAYELCGIALYCFAIKT